MGMGKTFTEQREGGEEMCWRAWPRTQGMKETEQPRARQQTPGWGVGGTGC